MKCDELKPIDLECNMGKDVNGVEHREPWKAYDIDEVDAAIAELEALNHDLEEERRWRKFPDEKPTEDIKFLVINEKGFMQCCYYSPILHEFQIPVTHWMPLPSAPKEEK